MFNFFVLEWLRIVVGLDLVEAFEIERWLLARGIFEITNVLVTQRVLG